MFQVRNKNLKMSKKETITDIIKNNSLYEFSRELIISPRKIAYQIANFQMLGTYRKIGKKIVEEQGGIKQVLK